MECQVAYLRIHWITIKAVFFAKIEQKGISVKEGALNRGSEAAILGEICAGIHR
jgi:hypothetical protein